MGVCSDVRTSERGIEFIKEREGFSATPYYCTGGRLTIGYGDTLNVHLGQVTTEEEADAKLRARLVEFENAVEHYVEVPLNQNQYDALVALVYNIGVPRFSTSSVVKRLNAGLPASTVAPAFMKWNKVTVRDKNGKPVLDEKGKPKLKVDPGLVKRREKEIALFLEPMPN